MKAKVLVKTVRRGELVSVRIHRIEVGELRKGWYVSVRGQRLAAYPCCPAVERLKDAYSYIAVYDETFIARKLRWKRRKRAFGGK